MHRLGPRLALFTCVAACGGSSSDDKPPTDEPEAVDTGEDTSEDTAEDTEPEATLPDGEPGPWQAGVQTFDADLTSGTAPGMVWYPTDDIAGSSIEYFPSIVGDALLDSTPTCDQPRPVILHSHGHGSAHFEMGWLAEHFASHGILTVAIDHPGNTYYDETPNFARLYQQRPTDVAELFDVLVSSLAAPGGPLDGCVDADAGYVVSGYSFGGYTAYAVAGATVNNPMGEPTYDFHDPRATAQRPQSTESQSHRAPQGRRFRYTSTLYSLLVRQMGK